MPDVCLEADVPYEILVQMGEKKTKVTDRTAAVLIDSIILVPPTEELFISQGISTDSHHR